MTDTATYTTVSVWDEILGQWNELGEWADHNTAMRWLDDRRRHNEEADTNERYQIRTVTEQLVS